MNLVFGANVRDGGAFATAGVTAAATTGVDSDVPDVESSAHPSPTAAPPRITAHNHVCCLILFLSPCLSAARDTKKQARPPALAPELSL